MSISQPLSITNRIDGVLTDADSLPVLRDATNTFGVKATVAGTVVVAPGTALTRTGLGAYTYLVTGLTTGTSYTYDVEVLNDGDLTRTQPRAFVATDSGTLPTSVLFTWSQFVKRWGLKTITDMANKDGPPVGQSIDYSAVQLSFDYATDEIFGNLYGGVLAVPLDWTPNSGVVPNRVSERAMVLAFWKLSFDSRKHDTNAGKVRAGMRDNVSRMNADVYDWLGLVKAGTLQIPEAAVCATVNQYGNGPVAVFGPRRWGRALDQAPLFYGGYWGGGGFCYP